MTPEELTAAAEIARRPDLFIQSAFGVTLDDWQAGALRALADRVLWIEGEDGSPPPNVAIRSGHGVGKTSTAAWAAICALALWGATVPCTAPTQHQLTDLLWPEIRRWLTVAKGVGDVLAYAERRVVNKELPTAFAVQVVGKNPEALAGFHAKRLLYIVDEGSGVPDESMAVVNGALTNEGAACLMIGNPTRPTGFFIDAFGRNSNMWKNYTVSCEDSPRVSNAWVEEMAQTWGRDSDVFRVRVLGLPPLAEPGAFIPGHLVRTAMEPSRYEAAIPEGRLEIGVDVARYGDDFSAVCARRGMKPIYLQKRHGLGNPAVAAWVCQVVWEQSLPGERPIIRVDDDGVGGGVTDMLRVASGERVDELPDAERTQMSSVDRALEAIVQPCNFGGSGDMWFGTNAGVWWGRIRKLLQQGQLVLPNDSALEQQLTTRGASMNLRGKVILEPKDHMKARGLPSPDLADALVLAYAGGAGSDWVTFLENQYENIYGRPYEPGAETPMTVEEMERRGLLEKDPEDERTKVAYTEDGRPVRVIE